MNETQHLLNAADSLQSASIDDLVQKCGGTVHPDAWMEFLQRFHHLIAAVVKRTCRQWGEIAPDVVDDLIQETYLKLCANERSLLVHFRPQHPNAFLGYIKTIAINLVYDYFRSRHAFKRNIDNEVELKEGFEHPVTAYGHAKRSENEILLRQIDKMLRERGTGVAAAKERLIFWLYYRYGLTAKEIASIPAMELTVKGVESVCFRITKFLKKSIAGSGLQ